MLQCIVLVCLICSSLIGHPISSMKILDWLLHEGDYSHILVSILSYVSANDLASLQRTNDEWRYFIQEKIWGDKVLMTRMRKMWGSYMPTTTIKSNKAKVLCMRCDEKYLICGEACSGQIVIYKRQDFNLSWEGYMLRPTNIDAGQPLILAGAHKHSDHTVKEGKHITPSRVIKAHSAGEDVTCLSFNNTILISGSSSGSLKVFKLETGELIGDLSLPLLSMGYKCVRIVGQMVVAAAGHNVTVQIFKSSDQEKIIRFNGCNFLSG